MKETILTIAAHNDDQVIGAGGTLAKYAKQGKRVRTIIFSFGEASAPHLKREVIIEQRVRESIAADKIMGGSGVAYFDLKEGKFGEEIKKKNIEKKLAEIINKEKPIMIFTHGVDDMHPDHIVVHKLVMSMIEKKKIACPVYSFDIWSLLKFRKRNLPRMVVDVSNNFTLKVQGFLEHKSQLKAWMVGNWALLWKLVIKDWFSGLLYGHKFAEVFYRLK